MVLGLTFVLRWAATGDARVARDDGCESVERRGGWRRRCSHGAGPGTVMRGREVGRREVEGSAVRRRRVGMPCGFAEEVELVMSEGTELQCSSTEMGKSFLIFGGKQATLSPSVLTPHTVLGAWAHECAPAATHVPRSQALIILVPRIAGPRAPRGARASRFSPLRITSVRTSTSTAYR